MSRGPYVRPVSTTSWWLRQPRYVQYMAREASCIFIGAYTGVVVVGVMQLSRGEAAWNSFLAAMHTPASIVFHLLALAFALYHTTTWFNVTPKAMPLQIGETRIPGSAIVAAHYVGWALVSVMVLFFVGAGT